MASFSELLWSVIRPTGDKKAIRSLPVTKDASGGVVEVGAASPSFSIFYKPSGGIAAYASGNNKITLTSPTYSLRVYPVGGPLYVQVNATSDYEAELFLTSIPLLDDAAPVGALSIAYPVVMCLADQFTDIPKIGFFPNGITRIDFSIADSTAPPNTVICQGNF